MQWVLKEVARLVGGDITAGDPAQKCNDPVCDSRRVIAGSIFVPLHGEKVDGHQFIADAKRHGAVASFMRKGWPGDLPDGLVIIQVDEPLEALQIWAHIYLQTLSARIVGVTGSTGKTTTKEMVAAVLSAGYAVGKNRGNLNTEIGLPLTVLQAEADREVLVLEMGMRGQGEILQLTAIAQPEIAVITNIGETHIELLGSIENIARAKGEILEGMLPQGIAVLNGDDEMVVNQAGRAPGRVIWFGRQCQDRGECVFADQVESHGDSLQYLAHWQGASQMVAIPWPGQHNLYNSLAAITVGLALEMSLEQCVRGLATYQPADSRLRVVPTACGAMMIDDTYNASPVSMRAALQVLKEYPEGQRRFAVLGDMLELGHCGPVAHQELGQLVAVLGLDGLFTVGPLASLIAAVARQQRSPVPITETFVDNRSLVLRLEQVLRPGDLVLVKGSRGMRMEEIVERLTGEEGTGGDH